MSKKVKGKKFTAVGLDGGKFILVKAGRVYGDTFIAESIYDLCEVLKSEPEPVVVTFDPAGVKNLVEAVGGPLMVDAQPQVINREEGGQG